MSGGVSRRRLLLAVALSDVGMTGALAATAPRDEEVSAATIARLLGGAQAQVGRIEVVLPQISESGNAVPLSVSVDSPMTAGDHVRSIHVVAERNPRSWIASFTLGPHAGRAAIETRIRLSDSQTVTVLAQMSDSSWWMRKTEVTVIIGACDSRGPNY